jgi:hypothetical protein
MEGYGVSQQTDEGYSEDPLNPPSPSTLALPSNFKQLESTGASPLQIKGWLSQHIGSLPAELRTRT